MNMLGDLNEKYDGLCQRMDALTQALHEFPRGDQTHSLKLREWNPFQLTDGGKVGASATTITIGSSGAAITPAPRGWEAYVERLILTADGASSSAFAAVFTGQAAGPTVLVDRAATFALVNIAGVAVYTNVADYNSPLYFIDGEPLIVEFGGCANNANVTVVAMGRQREL